MRLVGRIIIELPPEVIRDLDYVVKARGCSRNALLKIIIAGFLEQTVPKVARELHRKQVEEKYGRPSGDLTYKDLIEEAKP